MRPRGMPGRLARGEPRRQHSRRFHRRSDSREVTGILWCPWMRLRPLTLDDVVPGARLTAEAFGGEPRESRLRRYLQLEPEGWFALEDAGALVALGGAGRVGPPALLRLLVGR